MDATILTIIILSLLKFSSSFALAEADSYEQEGGGTEFPFRQAKIKYHRSRYCITAFGETNCVRKEESPGDAATIAKLYKIWMQGYELSPDRILRTILRVHKNIKRSKLRQGKPSQKTKQAVLNHIVKLNKLSQRTKKGKLSQLVKKGGVKENRVHWNVAGHHNHVAPIPRIKKI